MFNRKVGLYVVSLWLLFLFVIVITIDIPVCFEQHCKFIGIKELAAKNVVPLICLILAFWGFLEYRKFTFDLKGAPELPFKIQKIDSINYEHLTFLATYVIPLVTFDFESTRYLIVLSLLLIVMCFIYVKTDLFYANPSLALLGFHIYKADGAFKTNKVHENIVLITLTKLSQGDKVNYIKLDNRIYYVAKV